MKLVNKPSDVPRGPHFALLLYTTQSVPKLGDEYPGYGSVVGEETVESFYHYVTKDEEKLKKMVLKLESEKCYEDKKPYIVLSVADVVNVELQVGVKIYKK